MALRRKFRPGRRIRTMAAMSRQIDDGRYTFFHNKPQHPGWVASMTYRTIRIFVRGGSVRYAIENKETT